MTVARATPSRNSTVFLPLLVSSARVSHRPHRAPGPIRRATPPSLAPPAASPRLFGQQPNRRVVCETSDPDRSRSRSLPQVKCGVCHELLLRGQKEEHEKVCLGRVCRPLAAKNPAAAAAPAAQARLAGFNGTREPKLAALPRAAPIRTARIRRTSYPRTRRTPRPVIPCTRDASLPRRTFPRARLSPRRTRRARRRRRAPAPAPDSLEDSDKGLDLKERLKKHEGMATLKPNPHKVYIGDRAEVGGRKGTVMFVGPAEFAGGGVVVGMRLDEKRSTSECDGKYDGERLFRCKAGFGIFVPVEDVKKLEEETDGDDWESLRAPRGPPSRSASVRSVDALEHVVGQSAAKQKIQAIVNALQVNHRRVQAGGAPSPRRTWCSPAPPARANPMLARLVAHIVSECDVSRHGPLVRPSRADLVAIGRGPGRTAELIAQQCEKAEGGVLLIDNFHRMLPTSDAGNVRESPGMEAMEALAAEVERRARKAGKGVVLILAGEADGIAAARRLCPPLDAVLPAPVVLPRFRPRRGGAAGGPDGE